jgi:hypothetical protein
MSVQQPEPSDSPAVDPAPSEAKDGAVGERLTWAGNRPLDTRGWWSPALMIVVGVVVIGFQWSAIRVDGGIALNWVMVAVGAGVAIAGLVSLRRAHAVHQASEGDSPTT